MSSLEISSGERESTRSLEERFSFLILVVDFAILVEISPLGAAAGDSVVLDLGV